MKVIVNLCPQYTVVDDNVLISLMIHYKDPEAIKTMSTTDILRIIASACIDTSEARLKRELDENANKDSK